MPIPFRARSDPDRADQSRPGRTKLDLTDPTQANQPTDKKMRHSLLPLLPILLPSSVTALPSWQPWNNPANPAPSSLPQSQNPQALYTMTNDVTGNTVIAIPLDSNGMPSSSSGSSTVKYYSTGGVGGNYVSPVDGAPHFPDALSAQDAMVVAGDVSCPHIPTLPILFEVFLVLQHLLCCLSGWVSHRLEHG